MDESNPARRTQSSLWVLLAWVVGSAFFFGLTRGATGFWWVVGSPPGVGLLRINLDRVIGVALLACGTLIAATIVGAAISAIGGRRAVGLGIAWRALALAYLAATGAALSGLLRTPEEPSPLFGLIVTTSLPLKITAMAGTVGIVGVLLGMAPMRSRRRPVRSSWATLILAGAAGVLFLACWNMNLCYLVLLALEAVSNATLRPGQMAEWVARGGHADAILTDRGLHRFLHERVVAVGVASGIALALCLLTARWLGRDLRGPSREAAVGRRGFGLAYRWMTAMSTWAMGVYLIFHALPYLHPSLAEGGHTLLYPWGTGAIIAGFLFLSAGLSARGLAAPEVEEPVPPPRWLRQAIRLLKVGLAAGLIRVILAAIARMTGQVFHPWTDSASLRSWLEAVHGALTIQKGSTVYFDPIDASETLVMVIGFVGIAVATLRPVFCRAAPDREAPIDRIGRSPALIARWLGAWLAMLGVMLTLFPALVLAAMAVVHLTVRFTY